MKLVQVMEVSKPKSKTAAEHFNCCPACGETGLIVVSPEVVCASCPWDSTKWSVSMGRMDDLFAATIEHLRGEHTDEKLPAPRPKILPNESIPKFKKELGNAS